MKIFDTFIFYNELDVLEIRLNELSKIIDYFVIIESDKTFKGDTKPAHYLNNQDRYRKWHDKIIYVQVNDMPRFLGNPWELESFQRNCILRGLDHASPDDLILISDVDEIPRADAVSAVTKDEKLDNSIFCFEQKFCMHYLNWCLDEPWVGTRALKRKFLNRPQSTRKVRPIATATNEWARLKREIKWLTRTFRYHGRYLNREVVKDGGWHFSYLGDADFVRNKIRSFSHTELDTDSYMGENKIEAKLAGGIDIFGREPKILQDQELPVYVQLNLDRYSKLINR